MRVHDSLRIERHGDSTTLMVRRTQLNEALIAVILCIGSGWIIVAVVPGLFRWFIGALVLILTIASANRALRIEVQVEADRVRVANYWRTFRFDWVDVREIGMGAVMQGILPQPCVAFRLADNRVVCVQATPRNDAERQRFLEELAVFAPERVRWRVPEMSGLGHDHDQSNATTG